MWSDCKCVVMICWVFSSLQVSCHYPLDSPHYRISPVWTCPLPTSSHGRDFQTWHTVCLLPFNLPFYIYYYFCKQHILMVVFVWLFFFCLFSLIFFFPYVSQSASKRVPVIRDVMCSLFWLCGRLLGHISGTGQVFVCGAAQFHRCWKASSTEQNLICSKKTLRICLASDAAIPLYTKLDPFPIIVFVLLTILKSIPAGKMPIIQPHS